MFFCPIDKTPGGASVTYVLLSIKISSPVGRFLPLQCVALIGGVSLCDEGVKKLLAKTLNPSGLRPPPLYFHAKTQGRSIACSHASPHFVSIGTRTGLSIFVA